MYRSRSGGLAFFFVACLSPSFVAAAQVGVPDTAHTVADGGGVLVHLFVYRALSGDEGGGGTTRAWGVGGRVGVRVTRFLIPYAAINQANPRGPLPWTGTYRSQHAQVGLRMQFGGRGNNLRPYLDFAWVHASHTGPLQSGEGRFWSNGSGLGAGAIWLHWSPLALDLGLRFDRFRFAAGEIDGTKLTNLQPYHVNELELSVGAALFVELW